MPKLSCAPAPDVPLESKVAFLRQPSSYREAPYRIETVETHMAWVFLTERHAYKLKKPVRLGQIDLASVNARRHLCEEEVRLNRRLAPAVYLGLVPLALDPGGHLELGGDGVAVDWLVRMRRLPAAFMLDYVLRHGQGSARDMRRVAARLTRFYAALTPASLCGSALRARFAHQVTEAEGELLNPSFRLPAGRVRRVCCTLAAALDRLAPQIDARAVAGKVVEGHGDLRPEHICLYPDVTVIDCLEFSAELRIVDRADEIAFLALEIERLGTPALAATLVQVYRELSHDCPSEALIAFYQGFRALVRALLAIRHLKEQQFRYSPKWSATALEYLRAAELHGAA